MTELQNPPRIVLAGLTSAGKTAFLRTFLRNSNIGTVHAGSGTTTLVEDYSISLENDKDTLFIIYDTPGFQYTHGLMSLLLNRFPERDLYSFSIAEISNLIPNGEDNPDSAPFRHDALSWNVIQTSDTVLAIIDVTEDPDSNGPQKSLLRFWKLIQKEKSIIVILNKSYSVADGDLYIEKWRRNLAKEGLEAVIEYDVQCLNMKAESALFNELSDIYPLLRRRFMRLKEKRIAEQEKKFQSSIQETAKYLLKLSKTKEKLGKGEDSRNRYVSEKTEKKLQTQLKKAEEQFIQIITKIWGFNPSIISDIGDFSPYVHRVEKTLSKQRIATGAAIGAVIDIPFAGFSLGAGTLIGAVTGGIVGKVYDTFQKKCFNSSGKSIYYIPDYKFFSAAIDRSLGLLIALHLRGHGTSDDTVLSLNKLPTINIPQATQYLQDIAQSSQTFSRPPYLANALDKISMLTAMDYTKKNDERLARILAGYLSNQFNHITLEE